MGKMYKTQRVIEVSILCVRVLGGRCLGRFCGEGGGDGKGNIDLDGSKLGDV